MKKYNPNTELNFDLNDTESEDLFSDNEESELVNYDEAWQDLIDEMNKLYNRDNGN